MFARGHAIQGARVWTGRRGSHGTLHGIEYGEDVEAPLNPPGVARFVYDKHNRVSTNGKLFYRTVRSAAAQERVKSEREKEKEGKPAVHPLSYVCAECEYERVTGDMQAQLNHTCVREAEEAFHERQQEEGGFYH